MAAVHAPAPVSWHDPVVGPLDHIEIDGYLSIRSARIELTQMNVLIGANGAGKSNLIGALRLLGDIADGRLRLHVGRRGGADALLHFGRKKTKQLRIRAGFGSKTYECVLEPSVRETLIFANERISVTPGENREEDLGSGHDETLLAAEGFSGKTKLAAQQLIARGVGAVSAVEQLDIVRTMRDWKVFQFHDTSASAGMKLKHAIDDNRTLLPDGANVAAVLHAMRQTHPVKYRAVVDFVRSIAPFFDDFILDPDELDPSKIMLEWRHRSDPSRFQAHALSDGTLRFICLATLLQQPNKSSMIIIDEPELGLHPAAVMMLSELLRLASHHNQVMVATQSVTLLDQFAAEDVIVVDRTNGESTFRRLTNDQIKAWADDYSLGDLWLKNVLGGRPA